MKIIAYTFFTIVACIITSLVGGMTLRIIWSWFIVPQFGLAQLSIPEAIGIGLIAKYLSHQKPMEKEEPYWKTLLEGFSFCLVRAMLILLTGYIVKLFL